MSGLSDCLYPTFGMKVLIDLLACGLHLNVVVIRSIRVIGVIRVIRGVRVIRGY